MEEKGQRQPQRQTAKEVIAANVQQLIQQLEQGHNETMTAYLTRDESSRDHIVTGKIPHWHRERIRVNARSGKMPKLIE